MQSYKSTPLQSAAVTHAGTVRTVNEDSVFADPSTGVWAVADGMGGHAAGDVASQMVVQGLAGVPLGALADMVDQVEARLLQANEQIRQHAQQSYEGRTMGSTVVCLLVSKQQGACVWAGDSRLYLARANVLHRLSRDHSQVEELVQQGLLSAEQAKKHPSANVITRAVGAMDPLVLEVKLLDIQAGDAYLLCSDGVSNVLDPQRIGQLLCHGNAEQSAQSLIHEALDAGATDNVSAVVVKV